jgi:hypothetical protein
VGEVCDDGNLLNGDNCNPTCNLANTTTLFAGDPGTSGLIDGIGTAARFGGWGTMTTDGTYLWYIEWNDHVVRRIEISTAAVLTVAGDYPTGNSGDVDDAVGLNARFNGPEAITTDGNTLWVADAANHKLKEVGTDSPWPVTTVAGSGAAAVTDGFGTAAAFHDQRALTYYDGYVYSLDGTAAVLRRYDPVTTEVVTIAGQAYVTTGLDGYGTAATFESPRYMTSDNSGMLYISDTMGGKIRYYNTVTTYVGTFAGSGTAGYTDGIGPAAEIHSPRGMTSDGTSIYFTENLQDTIRQGVLGTYEISTNVGQHCDGTMPCDGSYNEGIGTAALLNSPVGLVFHYPSNSLFFFDSGNHVIRRIQ